MLIVFYYTLYRKQGTILESNFKAIRNVKFYNHLQLVNALHNDFGRHFVASFVFVIGGCQVLFLLSLIKAMENPDENLIVIVIFASFVTFIYALIAILLPLCTIIERRSQDFLEMAKAQLRNRRGGRKNEEYLRRAMSMRVIGTDIGRFGTMSIGCAMELNAQIFSHVLLFLSL